MTPIPAGRRSTRITIERPVDRDVPGKAGKVKEWQQVTKAWAARDQRQGSEVFAAQQLMPDSPEVFAIPAQRGVAIDSTMRVAMEGPHGRQVFAIVQVRVSDDRSTTTLVCRAGVRSDS